MTTTPAFIFGKQSRLSFWENDTCLHFGITTGHRLCVHFGKTRIFHPVSNLPPCDESSTLCQIFHPVSDYKRREVTLIPFKTSNMTRKSTSNPTKRAATDMEPTTSDRRKRTAAQALRAPASICNQLSFSDEVSV